MSATSGDIYGVINTTPNPFFFTGKVGFTEYTVQLLPNENPNKANCGGSWAIGLDRLFMYPKSYFCWLRGGHTFVEYFREYHYDSSETANTRCTKCDMWVPF